MVYYIHLRDGAKILVDHGETRETTQFHHECDFNNSAERGFYSEFRQTLTEII